VLGQKGVSQVLSPHLMKEFGRTGSFSDVAIFYELRRGCFATCCRLCSAREHF